MAGALPVLKHILISIKDENIKNVGIEKVDMHFKWIVWSTQNRKQVQNNHTEQKNDEVSTEI